MPAQPSRAKANRLPRIQRRRSVPAPPAQRWRRRVHWRLRGLMLVAYREEGRRRLHRLRRRSGTRRVRRRTPRRIGGLATTPLTNHRRPLAGRRARPGSEAHRRGPGRPLGLEAALRRRRHRRTRLACRGPQACRQTRRACRPVQQAAAKSQRKGGRSWRSRRAAPTRAMLGRLPPSRVGRRQRCRCQMAVSRQRRSAVCHRPRAMMGLRRNRSGSRGKP
jgi:hypothetical protein